MAKQIQTFGYEGLTILAFIEHLKGSGTKLVIDVRANPLSKKYGFSRSCSQLTWKRPVSSTCTLPASARQSRYATALGRW